MASGPCGVEFRDAFSCFHYSEEDPKGSDCIDNFRTMQECMVSYPDLYPVGGEDKAEDKKEKEELAKDEASSSIPDEDSQVKSAPTSEEKEELPNEEASSSSAHAESPVETAPPSSVEHKTDEIAEEAKVSDQPESKS